MSTRGQKKKRALAICSFETFDPHHTAQTYSGVFVKKIFTTDRMLSPQRGQRPSNSKTYMEEDVSTIISLQFHFEETIHFVFVIIAVISICS